MQTVPSILHDDAAFLTPEELFVSQPLRTCPIHYELSTPSTKITYNTAPLTQEKGQTHKWHLPMYTQHYSRKVVKGGQQMN